MNFEDTELEIGLAIGDVWFYVAHRSYFNSDVAMQTVSIDVEEIIKKVVAEMGGAIITS